MKRYGHYINGAYVQNDAFIERIFPDPLAGPSPIAISTLSLKDPSSTEIIEAALTGAHETHQQVQEGFFPLEERISFLQRLAQSIEEHQENIAQLLMRESKKPLKLARIEVGRALNTLKVTLQSAPEFFQPKIYDKDPLISSDHYIEVSRRARGVILAITPFNFPVNLVAHKLFPAIASGSPTILKPSDKTPLTALYLVDLCHHARLPAGMLQLLHCENEVSQKLAADPRIAFLSFTGSSSVGWNLVKNVSVPFSLELGGNAPVYVDQSADLKLAAKKISEGAFMYAGQSCISVQNVYTHKSIASAFEKILKAEVEAFPYGDYENENVLCSGPVTAEAQIRISKTLQELLAKGAVELAKSKNYLGEQNSQSEYIVPTLLGNIQEESGFCREEIFAPVMSLTPVDSFEQFLRIAKSRSHRLQCGIFTQNPEHAFQAQELDYGGILINESSTFRLDALPYGGQGLAGVGREGPLYAMEDYTTYKTVLKKVK